MVSSVASQQSQKFAFFAVIKIEKTLYSLKRLQFICVLCEGHEPLHQPESMQSESYCGVEGTRWAFIDATFWGIGLVE